MERINKELVYRYARAFLNSVHCTRADVDALMQASKKIEENPKPLFLIDRVYSMSSDPDQLIMLVLNYYQLPEVVSQLLALLIHHKRAFMVGKIVHAIVELYYEQKGIIQFTVSSNPILTSAERQQIERFVSNTFGTGHIFLYKHDPQLIAGVRMVSTTAFWEYSYAQQLREMATLLTR